jgi:hypothetical protein
MNRKGTSIVVSLAILSAGALTILPGTGNAASRTQTLRFFDKPVSMKVTHSDGTVVAHPPFPEPRTGDTLDVNSLDYSGNHSRHSKRFIASAHVRCTFGAGPPTCVSQVAIDDSLLIFTGTPGTVSNGTGKYQGATGRVISSKKLKNNASDIVARIYLRS